MKADTRPPCSLLHPCQQQEQSGLQPSRGAAGVPRARTPDTTLTSTTQRQRRRRPDCLCRMMHWLTPLSARPRELAEHRPTRTSARPAITPSIPAITQHGKSDSSDNEKSSCKILMNRGGWIERRGRYVDPPVSGSDLNPRTPVIRLLLSAPRQPAPWGFGSFEFSLNRYRHGEVQAFAQEGGGPTVSPSLLVNGPKVEGFLHQWRGISFSSPDPSQPPPTACLFLLPWIHFLESRHERNRRRGACPLLCWTIPESFIPWRVSVGGCVFTGSLASSCRLWVLYDPPSPPQPWRAR